MVYNKNNIVGFIAMNNGDMQIKQQWSYNYYTGCLAHPGVCSAAEEVEEESEPVPAKGGPEVEGVTKLVKMGILYNVQ